jgi:Predicted permeases
LITLIYSVFLVLTGIVAGLVGALTGLGGAVIITPVLSILFGVPLEYAAGASLVSTIATSSGAATTYIRDRITNVRIGMSLEIATTLGAIAGSLSAAFVYTHNLSYLLFIVFGAVILLSVYPVIRDGGVKARLKSDWSTKFFELRGRYYDKALKREVKYSGIRWWFGESVMLVAGVVSGLLGVGSGVLKVLAMDSGMHLPIKVSTSTSDFMIGVTAVTGSVIYWELGYIQPLLVAPILIGVLVGAYVGSAIMEKEPSRKLKNIFMLVLVVVAIEMILRGLGIA